MAINFPNTPTDGQVFKDTTGVSWVYETATNSWTSAAAKSTKEWDKVGTTLSPHTVGDVVTVSAGTAALPGLTPVGDPNTGIWSPGPDQLAISTGGIGRAHVAANGNVGIGVTAPTAAGGILQLNGGITFPATQVASTDPNTLDDYEEGTWTPTQGPGLTVVGAFSSSGTYIKIGKVVHLFGQVSGATSVAAAAGNLMVSGAPFPIKGGINGAAPGLALPQNGEGSVVQFTNTSFYAKTAIAATPTIRFSATYEVG